MNLKICFKTLRISCDDKKNHKNWKIDFFIRFRTLHIFWEYKKKCQGVPRWLKMYHIWKTKKCKNRKINFYSFQLIAHLSYKFGHFWTIFLVGDSLENSCVSPWFANTISRNSKNKIQKIDFQFDSALCASFMKLGTKLRIGRMYKYILT